MGSDSANAFAVCAPETNRISDCLLLAAAAGATCVRFEWQKVAALCAHKSHATKSAAQQVRLVSGKKSLPAIEIEQRFSAAFTRKKGRLRTARQLQKKAPIAHLAAAAAADVDLVTVDCVCCAHSCARVSCRSLADRISLVSLNLSSTNSSSSSIRSSNSGRAADFCLFFPSGRL